MTAYVTTFSSLKGGVSRTTLLVDEFLDEEMTPHEVQPASSRRQAARASLDDPSARSIAK